MAIKGINEVKINLKNYDKRTSMRLKAAFEAAAAETANDAKSIVPVKDGHLQASIQPGPVKMGLTQIMVEVNANMVYAAAIEFGLPVGHFPPWFPRSVLSFPAARSIAENGTRPQPYLGPSVLKNQKRLRQLVKRAVEP